MPLCLPPCVTCAICGHRPCASYDLLRQGQCQHKNPLWIHASDHIIMWYVVISRLFRPQPQGGATLTGIPGTPPRTGARRTERGSGGMEGGCPGQRSSGGGTGRPCWASQRLSVEWGKDNSAIVDIKSVGADWLCPKTILTGLVWWIQHYLLALMLHSAYHWHIHNMKTSTYSILIILKHKRN